VALPNRLRIGIPGLALIALLVFLIGMRFYPLEAGKARELRAEFDRLHAQCGMGEGAGGGTA
jgi:hypothetical protein